MPVKEKSSAPDPTLELLKQILDTQKEQTEIIKKASEVVLKTASNQRRDRIIKVIFYAFIVGFSIISTYYFYNTLATQMGSAIPNL